MTSQTSNRVARKDDAPAGRARTVSFEDEALVDAARKGDMQAYGSLVAKYQDRIYNMVLRMCGRVADAEELTQDVFLRALERISQFRGRSSFYTWLFRVAANLVLSHRRRAGRVRFQSLTTDERFDETQADGLTAAVAARRNPAPEAAAMSAETELKVMAALETLDEEFRLVVVLCDVEEMEYARAAEVLGLPVGTVKSRLHRARCILRDKLSDLVA